MTRPATDVAGAAGAKAPFRLADLTEPAIPVELPGGRVAQVRMIDGIGMQMRAQIETSSDDTLLWQLAARCLPGVPEAEVFALSPSQAAAIIAIACGAADRLMTHIEAQAPERPEGNGTAPAKVKARRRRSASGTTSRAS